MSTDSVCPPKRVDYTDENGNFNAREYFTAIHKCNQEKANKMNISETTNPEYCENKNTMKEKEENDKLIKFKNERGNIHCMYFSELKLHIQNICNIYTQWTCVNENLCDKIDENTGKPDTSGRGYAPKLQAYDLLGILKFTNHCCIINHIYWQVPLFSKGLLSMKTILKIQELVSDDEDKVEITVSSLTKTKDDFRLGNIYGTFGIGQTHAQADPTTFYVLESESEIEPTNLDDCDIKPNNYMFNFDKIEKKLTLQLEIKDLINNLYNRPLDLYSDEVLKNFLLDNEQGFTEEDLCPDTETVVQLFFMYYNNDILVPAVDNIESIRKLTENMTLINMREIINENQETLEKQNRAKNDASIDMGSHADLMNMSIQDSPIMSMSTPVRSSPRVGALFSDSPMSPINGSLLDTSVRSDYDIAIGNESTYIDRSPSLRSLHLSDLVNTPESADNVLTPNRLIPSSHDYFDNLARQSDDADTTTPHNLAGQFDDADTTTPHNLAGHFNVAATPDNLAGHFNVAATPPNSAGGGKKTFNRKKKPKKNKTKKKKYTRKRTKNKN